MQPIKCSYKVIYRQNNLDDLDKETPQKETFQFASTVLIRIGQTTIFYL
jgi:hypothetical protein